MKLFLTFSFLFAFHMQFSQDIKLLIIDKETKKAIENAEVAYNNRLFTTNKTGLVLFELKQGQSKVVVTHIQYKKFVFFIDKNKTDYSIELEEKIYSNEIVVSAYRQKPVIINETEKKQKNVAVSKELIKLSNDINTLVSTIDNVHIDKSIDGGSNINVMASNSDEINFKINHLDLFLLSSAESHLNSLIPLSLKSIDLDLGNSDHFIGSINAQFDYSSKNNLVATLGNDYSDVKLSYNVNEENTIFLNSVSYNGISRSYEVIDNNGLVFDYPISDEYFRLNSLQYFHLEDLEIENVVIADYNRRFFLTSIDKPSIYFASGLNAKYKKDLTFFNNLNYYSSDYSNLSNPLTQVTRSDNIIENKIGVQYKQKFEVNSITAEASISSYSNDIDEVIHTNSRQLESSDSKQNVTVIFKHLPERSKEESRIIFEVNLSIGRYQNEFYVENLGLKSSMDVSKNPFVWEFYTDLTFNKRPFLNTQKIYLNTPNQFKFLKTENLLFGTKINYRNFSFDFNYSNRNYKQFLTKIYGLIFFNYDFNNNVIMRVYNATFSQDFGKNVKVNLSGQYFLSDNDLSIFNRPKLLLTNNYSWTYKQSEILMSVKYLRDRHVITRYNNVSFKRILDETILLNISYKYSNILDSKFSADVEISNLLKESNYTINGFNLKQRDIYFTLGYEF